MVNDNCFIAYIIYHCLKTCYNPQSSYNGEIKVNTNYVASYYKKIR